MEKVTAALPSRMRAFLDRLPAVLNVKATLLKKREEQRHRKQIAAFADRGARASSSEDAALLSVEPVNVCND